jgi:hypothetical protein
LKELSADDQEFLHRFLADPLVRIFTDKTALRPPDIAVAVETHQCVRADIASVGDPWEYELTPGGFRSGDEFFMLLLVAGKISLDELKQFFPGAARGFDPVRGVIMRRIPTHVEERLIHGEQIPYEVGGEDRSGWPHFATHPELLERFARRFAKEGVQIYRWHKRSGRARKEPIILANAPSRRLGGNGCGAGWIGVGRERMLRDGEMPMPDESSETKKT